MLRWFKQVPRCSSSYTMWHLKIIHQMPLKLIRHTWGFRLTAACESESFILERLGTPHHCLMTNVFNIKWKLLPSTWKERRCCHVCTDTRVLIASAHHCPRHFFLLKMTHLMPVSLWDSGPNTQCNIQRALPVKSILLRCTWTTHIPGLKQAVPTCRAKTKTPNHLHQSSKYPSMLLAQIGLLLSTK